MDSFEWNKIIGAVLGTLLFVMGVGFIAEAIYHPIEDRGVGYALPGEEEGHGGAPVEEEPVQPLPVLLASADAGAGERQFAKCKSCHDPAEGGANKVGPGLWDVVGREIASHEGFSYSTAMVEHADDYPAWTYEALDEFLASPKDAVPGTKMSFAGLSDPEDRADMLAYLHTLSNDPVAFPEPEAAPAADEAATEEAAAEDHGAETMPSETTEQMAEQSSEAQGEEMVADEQAEPAPADVVAESPASTEPTEGEAVSEEVDAAGEAAESPAADEEPAMAEEPDAEEPAADDAAMTEEAPAEDAAATDEGAAAEEPAMEESGGADDAAMTEEPAAEPSGLAAQVASADVAVGQRQFAKCQACHDPSQGGANRVGPPLWDVVGNDVASHEYNYSSAMSDYASEQGTWTLEALDAYLLAPRDVVPGTKMTFAGMKKDDERHAVLAYLHSLSENPAPLE